jgi:hypothetical protein
MIVQALLLSICQPFRELTFPKVRKMAACQLLEYTAVHWATISEGDIGQGLESLASTDPSDNEQVE